MRVFIFFLCGVLLFLVLAGCKEERTCEEGATVTILFTGDVKGRLGPAG